VSNKYFIFNRRRLISAQLLTHLYQLSLLSESGCVYKRTLVENEDDYFQDYYITLGDGQYMSMNCDTVHGPPKQLPPAYYVMAVDADIYQRMFDEVSESISMPCGLFYCGHHDDVDYPSIRIAMVGVMITLSVMLVATICVGG
jgi:hypothetical protein